MNGNFQPPRCCFSGHRLIPKQEYAAVQQRLRETVCRLIEEGVTTFYAGGALGFDTMAALEVLDLKNEHPHIQLILVLPCKDQSSRWNLTDVTVYRSILARADKVMWQTEQYTSGCMQARNRYLVDNTDICVCYLKHSTGGTAYTVNYARKQGRSIYNVAEPDNDQLSFL